MTRLGHIVHVMYDEHEANQVLTAIETTLESNTLAPFSTGDSEAQLRATYHSFTRHLEPALFAMAGRPLRRRAFACTLRVRLLYTSMTRRESNVGTTTIRLGAHHH